ncbi:hypothetical protein [Paenibacillus sp. ISL-20]|uniref:hypothetical protein n=1 Tax=Paenibacillus sp. ISL-20 TaxID=2819163 RepID=UPI001BE68F32|nr:hypothetical protein [Paenibacillus sp. ISL-20]MBT2761790.1 hypothetical protein [Paenibacillus sp. ISL-20]
MPVNETISTFEEFMRDRYPIGYNDYDQECFIFFLRKQGFPVFTPISFVLTVYGEAGQAAINNGGTESDVIKALISSDPQNRMGYNTLF